MGYGPAAVERRALRIIAKLGGDVKYDKQWRGKSVVKIPSESDIVQLQTELDKCCELLVDHLRFVL
jgi:hypothetical protein